jgi:hypothetical protein
MDNVQKKVIIVKCLVVFLSLSVRMTYYYHNIDHTQI